MITRARRHEGDRLPSHRPSAGHGVDSASPTTEQISALSSLVCERALSPEQLGTVSALLDFVGRSVCAEHRAADDYPEVWGPLRTMYLRLIESLD